jgi:serine/threonine-protein kinase
MPLDTKRVQAVFRAAVESVSLIDRVVVVQRECAGDHELRQAVEALFHAYDDPACLLDQATADQPDQTKSPQLRYELEDEIARGSMASVWRARDLCLGRDIAVKVLLEPHHTRSELARRFADEARIASQLQHPGIAPIFNVGSLPDGRPFFTMKLVKGQTLAKLLAERISPHQHLSRFMAAFEQVCQTMAYAHARGVIHRGLKPEDVMVGAFGEVQVMDWGLSKVLPPDSRERNRPEGHTSAAADTPPPGTNDNGSPAATPTWAVVGSPAYMAPEQTRGEVQRVDERADVFSLGAILCEILTGSSPFLADAPTTTRSAQKDALTATLVRLEDCGADAELVTLAKACLAAEPEHRPRDAGEVARTNGTARASWEARLRQAELDQVRTGEKRKRRRLALAGAAAILALIGLSTYLFARAG